MVYRYRGKKCYQAFTLPSWGFCIFVHANGQKVLGSVKKEVTFKFWNKPLDTVLFPFIVTWCCLLLKKKALALLTLCPLLLMFILFLISNWLTYITVHKGKYHVILKNILSCNEKNWHIHHPGLLLADVRKIRCQGLEYNFLWCMLLLENFFGKEIYISFFLTFEFCFLLIALRSLGCKVLLFCRLEGFILHIFIKHWF